MKKFLILGIILIAIGCKAAELKFASPTLVTNVILALSVSKTNSTNFLANFFLSKTNMITATALLDFPDTSADQVATLQITVTGARIGDAVFLGIDPAVFTSTHPHTYIAWVSFDDEVSIRFVNTHSLNNYDPPEVLFRAVVFKP